MRSSPLLKNELIIDDATTEAEIADMSAGFARSWDPTGRPDGFGYAGIAVQFPDEMLVPQSDWPAMIREAEEQKARISDVLTRNNIPHKDQGKTNFCWVNGPAHAAETLRVMTGLPYESLSPASLGAPLTNYRNEGGWGREAVRRAVNVGFVPSRLWPDNAISRKYCTNANLQVAQRFRFEQWVECQPRNKAQMVSMAIRQFPGCLGFNWWGHLVMGCEAVILDGEVCLRIRNSWANWGANGFAVLRGAKMLADDATYPVAIHAATG